jgi:hypothetical protein
VTTLHAITSELLPEVRVLPTATPDDRPFWLSPDFKAHVIKACTFGTLLVRDTSPSSEDTFFIPIALL